MSDEQNRFRALKGDRLAEAEREAENYDIGPPDELGQAREQIQKLEVIVAAMKRDAENEGRRPLVTFALEDWEAAVEKQEKLEKKVCALTEEVAELTHIFELQHKREKPWIKRWRDWTGKHNSVPDYGDLLQFIITRIEWAEKERTEANESANYQLRRAESLSRNRGHDATVIRTLEERIEKLEKELVEAKENSNQQLYIDSLEEALKAERPVADVYRRVCKTLGIEKDILGYINGLKDGHKLAIEQAEAEYAALAGSIKWADNAKLRELLKKVEWRGFAAECLWCNSYESRGGHKPDCEWLLAINPDKEG